MFKFGFVILIVFNISVKLCLPEFSPGFGRGGIFTARMTKPDTEKPSRVCLRDISVKQKPFISGNFKYFISKRAVCFHRRLLLRFLFLRVCGFYLAGLCPPLRNFSFLTAAAAIIIRIDRITRHISPVFATVAAQAIFTVASGKTAFLSIISEKTFSV